ncbi:MAG: prepilin peptidase [Gemmatimonadetes bacterium]|nr:prepilin peptidase [Gemmatimonadota bacterium]
MASETAVLAIAGLVGLVVGSFLNVCIVRLPNNESLVRPRSKCPKCGAPIAWYDNVPLLSWLLLLGKCRHCKARISVQYPLIEGAVGVLWVAAFAYYGLTWAALTGATFSTLLLGIAMTDARHYLIPDEYTLGGLAIGLLLSLQRGFSGLLDAGVGAAVGFLLLYAVAWAGEKVFGQEAMGGGDIKMMAMVGSFVGWKGVLLTVFGGAALGTLIFIPLSFGKKRLVPFGVFLALAAGAVFVVGGAIVQWYMNFLRAA